MSFNLSQFPMPTPQPSIAPEANLNDDRHQMDPKMIEVMRKSPAYTHNNPGHITFQNQEGATEGDMASDGKGRWARFATPEKGIQAMVNDIINIKFAGKSRHITPKQTLGELIDVYTKTDQESYKQLIKQRTGLSDNIVIEKIPEKLHNALIKVMLRKENVQFYKENLEMINTMLPDSTPEILVKHGNLLYGSLYKFLKSKHAKTP